MARRTRDVFMALFFLVFSSTAWCGSISGLNGIGTVIEDNAGIARGMGGAGIADTGGLNMIQSNPALGSTFKKPVYGLGIVYDWTHTYTGGPESYTTGTSNPTLIRFVLPLFGKASFAWGLSPYSRTNAKVQLDSKPGDIYTDTMTSSGGINITNFEISGTMKSVSAGFAMNYYFGSIEEKWLRDFHDADGLNNTTDSMRKEYSGYGMSLGVLARLPRQTTVGLGYTTGSSLDRNVFIQPGFSTNSDVELGKGRAHIPSSWRIGITKDFSKKLIVSADLSRAGWEKSARGDEEKRMYSDAYMFGAGLRYTPSLSPVAGYLSTMPLSVGFRMGNLYYKSYPKVNTIEERAVTIGVGFPFKEKSGSLIVSYEIGTRGDKSRNGWDETFMKIGFTLVGVIK